jgi:diguanylate cyclase (GGDEF)-like protein
MLSHDVPTTEFIARARSLLAEFFAADAVIIVLNRAADESQRFGDAAPGLRVSVFEERTVRVLRSGVALRSAHGRSLHVPVRFGDELLGAVGVIGLRPDRYSAGDLALLADWAGLFGVHVNASRLADANSQLEALVGTDGLTGLRNRRGLSAELDRMWNAARPAGESIAIVMVDVDFFKPYNDNYGHPAGDACLRQLAHVLAAGLRPADVAARYGGEEFVVLLADADLDCAVAIAERLRESINALHIAHAGSALGYVTASFGVATALPAAGDVPADTLAQADALLYAAKTSGRNRVAATGYFAVSPAARADDGGDHNLPESGSSFCGRRGDVADVLAALDRSRLVTLVAFGGVGKTRVSLEVAGRRRGSFRHGVWFVDLAGSADPELLADRVAAAIGLPDVPGSRTIAGVAELLETRELLIVLDNCEHLIDACGRLCAAVLAVAPAVRILATSREQLGVSGEAVIKLAPLEMPSADTVVHVRDIARFPALKLFVDRALAIAPIPITDETVAIVAHICRRLDGIALAIELAAARVRLLTLDELRVRLDAAFAVVGRPGGSASPRQRTLRGLIDWSYDLLDERERRAFRGLGTFAGTFTLELASIVCAEGDVDVLDILEQLVDKSLVVLEPATTGARTFRLFESIREYARDRLAGTHEAIERRDRLWSTLRDRAAAIATASSTPRWRTAMEPLAHAIDDVRAYLEVAIVEGTDASAGAVIAADLALYWQEHGHAHEGRTWLERALALPNLAPAVRAKLLNALLWHQPLFGDAWTNDSLATEALALATEGGDEAQTSTALFHIGDAAFDLGDFSRAREFFTRALERFVASGDRYGEAYACNGIGVCVDLTEGIGGSGVTINDHTWYNRSIELCRQLERHGYAARVLGNVAESEFFVGRVDEGIAITKDALAGVTRENDRPAMGWLLCNLGLFHQITNEFDVAKAMILAALRVVVEIHDHWLVAGCCDNLAGIALHLNQPKRAAQFLGCAEQIFGDIKLSRQPLFARIAGAWTETARGLLGSEAFAGEFAAGMVLSRAELFELARAL